MAAALTVFRLGCAEANGYRVPVRFVGDVKLNEFHLVDPSGSRKERRAKRGKAFVGWGLIALRRCNRRTAGWTECRRLRETLATPATRGRCMLLHDELLPPERTE